MMRRAQPWLGTLVDISITQIDVDPTVAAVAINAAFAAVALVHRCMSFHDAESDVGAINRLAVGGACRVAPHTATVLRCALMLEAATDGGFNIACADTLMAWGQLPTTGGMTPSAATSGDSSSLPRFARTVLAVDDHDCVTRLHAGAIDLGGIAKGYAVDLAIAALQDAGVTSANVNAGGDLRTYGPTSMAVAIRDPADPARTGHVLQLQDRALATSAGYFSRRSSAGIDSTALVDTATGQPILHGRSISVLAPTCMLADGLTKPVIASGCLQHPVLARFGATALLL